MASPGDGENFATSADLIQFDLNLKDGSDDDELIDLENQFLKSPQEGATAKKSVPQDGATGAVKNVNSLASASFHTFPDVTTSSEGRDALDCTAELLVPEGGGGTVEQRVSEGGQETAELVNVSSGGGETLNEEPLEGESRAEGGNSAEVTASGFSPPDGAAGAVGAEKPLTVELLKEKELEAKSGGGTFTIGQEEEPPPSYEEAMGLVPNQSSASSSAANYRPPEYTPSNHGPALPQSTNQRPATNSAAKQISASRLVANEEPASNPAANGSAVRVAAPDGGNLYYLDFIPDFHFTQNLVDTEKTETFHQLVERANSWLSLNPSYALVTSETVIQYWARSHGYNPYRVIATRSKVSADPTVCMHVLRVWFRVDVHQVTPQVLHHQDFWTPYEKNVSDLVDMINSPTYKLPGKILRVETVPHNRGATSGERFDLRMRYTCAMESSAENKNYTFFLRVFTSRTAKQSTKVRKGYVGFMDFVPEKKREMNPMHPDFCFPHERYETFPALLRNFHWWLNNKMAPTSRLVSVQSLPVKIKTGGGQFWQRVNYTEKSGLYSVPSEYLVILRAFYEEFGAKSEHVLESRDIACRSFAPMQLSEGPVLKFENFVKMTERVALWVKVTGAKVRSVETVKIPMYSTALHDRFSDADPLTYTSWHILPRHYADHSHWIYVIRLYLDEPVEEPPAHAMPTAPNIVPYYLRPPPSSVAIQPGTKH